LFVYSSCGKCPFLPSPVEFSSHCHFYRLSCSWLLGGCHHSCLFRPACLFTVHERLPSCLRCSALFAMCLFFLLLFIIQFGFFSLFSLGGGQSVQGDM
jgi:hypothetical protein